MSWHKLLDISVHVRASWRSPFFCRGAGGGGCVQYGGRADPATGTWTGLASLEFVTVGDAGNAADADTGYGAVAYEYRIGKYDVTAGQYAEFLNAAAKTSDPYGLYREHECRGEQPGAATSSGRHGGQLQLHVAADWANRPVNFVSWGDAARFCNWLQTGGNRKWGLHPQRRDDQRSAIQ